MTQEELDAIALPTLTASPLQGAGRDGRGALWYDQRLTSKGWQPMRVEIQYCGQ